MYTYENGSACNVLAIIVVFFPLFFNFIVIKTLLKFFCVKVDPYPEMVYSLYARIVVFNKLTTTDQNV